MSKALWVIGASDGVTMIELPSDVTITTVAHHKGSEWGRICFATSDGRVGAVKMRSTGADLVLGYNRISYVAAPGIRQIVCAESYVALLNDQGEIWINTIDTSDNLRCLAILSEDGTPMRAIHMCGNGNRIVAVFDDGRFFRILVAEETVETRSPKGAAVGFVQAALFLSSVFLLGKDGVVYAGKEDDEAEPGSVTPTSDFITTMFSCRASLVFVRNDDRLVAYGYNKSGCLGIGNFDLVNSLMTYKPNLDGEGILDMGLDESCSFFVTRMGSLYYAGQLPSGGDAVSVPEVFEPLAGKIITQISANGGLFVAVEGGCIDYLRVAPPPGMFHDFPVVEETTFYKDQSGKLLEVLPYESEDYQIWFRPGEICGSEQGGDNMKVIGKTKAGESVAALEGSKRVVVVPPQHGGVDLKFEDYGDLVIRDASYVAEFGVVLDQKIVMPTGDVGFVEGVRGQYIWLRKEGQDVLHGITESEVRQSTEKAPGHCSEVKLSDKHTILTVNARRAYVFAHDQGLCEGVFYGRGQVLLKRLGDANVVRASDNEFYGIARCSSSDGYGADSRTVVTREGTEIEVKMVCSGPMFSHDRVKTPNGHGSFIGTIKEGRVVVLLDSEYFTTSFCDVFNSTEVELVGRMANEKCTKLIKTKNGELNLRIDPMNRETFGFVIADRVESTSRDRRGWVCGIREETNEVYAMMDDDRRFASVITKSAWRVVMSYAPIPLTRPGPEPSSGALSLSIISFSGLWAKPGDVLINKKHELVVIGVNDKREFAVFDKQKKKVKLMSDISGYKVRSDSF